MGKARINEVLKRKDLLCVYLTAGFPEIDSTIPVLEALTESGVDLIEIGIPFSDSLVDGATIQASNTQALKNGMTIKKLFAQLNDIRSKTKVPLIMMTGLNPVLAHGVEQFCIDCQKVGVDAVIIPDLPAEIFISEYAKIFEKYDLSNVYLVSPQTSDERIRYLDSISDSFIYAVSSYALTGEKLSESAFLNDYLGKIKALNLKHPVLVGFGISDAEGYRYVCKFTAGAIVGSAFIRALASGKQKLKDTVSSFVASLKE